MGTLTTGNGVPNPLRTKLPLNKWNRSAPNRREEA